MRRLSVLAITALACASLAKPQGRPIDAASYAGDAQRTGWEKTDSRITRENVKDFQLVLKRKLDNRETGPHSLTPPVVIGNLISYRGFKELAFVLGSSGKVWSIDADMDRMFWERQLDGSSAEANTASGCSDRVTAIPALTPPLNFAARRRPRPATENPSPGPPATPAGKAPAASPGQAPATVFGSRHPLFVLARDGKLHQLNTSTGTDQFPPVNFLPPHAIASSLALHDGILYTTANSACGGGPGAVWAIDLNEATPKAVSFVPKGGSVGGLGGFALGADATVYVQTGAGQSGTLYALGPKDLKPKQSFIAAGTGSVRPVVFTWNDRELVVSAGSEGKLYLLDALALGGDDRKTALYETAPVSKAGAWGGLSSWEDADGTRWVLAPVWGPVTPEMKAFSTNGPAPNGSIAAFKVEEHDGKPVLTPAWVSRDLSSPEPPVITSGVVFALSAGTYSGDGRPAGSSPAVLYALDATTGHEIYSTGTQVSAPANLTGLTIANGRVYFTTTDNTLYAFGVFLER